MAEDTTWLTPDVIAKLGLAEWATEIRPLLADYGDKAAAVFLLFDRRKPITVPEPKFDQQHAPNIVGLIAFNDDGGTGFSYTPASHVFRIDAGEQPVTLFGVLSRDMETLANYVDDYLRKAIGLVGDSGHWMSRVEVVYVPAVSPVH